LGFPPPSRYSCRSPLVDERSHAHLCSAPSVSHTLDGLLLLTPCGFVSPHYHVRDFTSGVFPNDQPKMAFATSYPLVVDASQRLAFRVSVQSLIRCALCGIYPSQSLDPLLCFLLPRASLGAP
jgi:hypothetical protein